MEVHVGNNGDTSDVTPDSAHPTTSPIEYAQWRRLGEIGFMDAKKARGSRLHSSAPGLLRVCDRHATWRTCGPASGRSTPCFLPMSRFTSRMHSCDGYDAAGCRRTALRVAGGKGQDVFPLLLILLTFPAGLLRHSFQYGLPSSARSHHRDHGLLLRSGVAATAEDACVEPKEHADSGQRSASLAEPREATLCFPSCKRKRRPRKRPPRRSRFRPTRTPACLGTE